MEASDTIEVINGNDLPCKSTPKPIKSAGDFSFSQASKINATVKYAWFPYLPDHATDIEFIKAACSYGFSSVMFDGSELPFDKNAKNTLEVVKFAHEKGITVEAELGHVGNAMVS